MKQTKLIEILAVLSNKELRQFQLFLNSPYFNSDSKVVDFYTLLKKLHPDFKEKLVSKEKLFAKLFPKEKFDDLKIRRVSSKLYKLLEKFIAIEVINKDEMQLKLAALSFYEEAVLLKPFKSTLNYSKKFQNEENFRDKTFYHHSFQLKHKERVYDFLDKKAKHDSRTSESIQEYVDSLEIYYLVNKLQICCSVYSQKNIINFDYNIYLIDEIIEGLEGHVYLKNPLVYLFYQTFFMLKDGDHNYFEEIKNELNVNASQLANKDLGLFYVYLKNYCVKQINLGNDEYFEFLLSLFEEELRNFTIARSQEITPNSFKNIVSTALRLKKMDWAETFIESNIHRVLPDFRDDVYKYNIAHVFFYQKKFDQAIQHLHQTEFKDIFFKLGARRLLLQIYHEMDEVEARDNLINSFRVFIHNKKETIAQIHVDKMRNFLNALTSISKILPKDQKAIQDMKRQIEEMKPVADKEWLLGMVEDLA